jgi:hypothetical protein
MNERKVVSTQVIHCHQYGDQGVDALLVTFDDGEVEVHCEGGCGAGCRYGTQVS